MTVLAREVETRDPTAGSQPQRISCRICQLNSRGIKFNLFDTAGGIVRGDSKGSQKVTRPNPFENDSTVTPNQSESPLFFPLKSPRDSRSLAGLPREAQRNFFRSSGALQQLEELAYSQRSANVMRARL